jgi:hypothetical protein
MVDKLYQKIGLMHRCRVCAESCLPSRLFEGLLWGNFMVLAGKFSNLGFDWAISRKQTLRMLSPAAANDCGFNRSMQHLISSDVEEDVENETETEDLLHRRTKGIDVGSLAKG